MNIFLYKQNKAKKKGFNTQNENGNSQDTKITQRILQMTKFVEKKRIKLEKLLTDSNSGY